MTLSIEEVERRLRCGDWDAEFADAIKAHRERCVDAEKVRAWLDKWDDGCTDTLAVLRGIRSLLPPQKSALRRAIEMVEKSDAHERGYLDWPKPVLALLREAEKEAK